MRRGIVVLALLTVGSLFAGDTPLDRATLRGLKSLNIIVDRLDPELANAGINPDELRARLAHGLEAVNVAVDADAREFLALRLMHVRARRGPYAVCLTLGVYQPVTLVRDKEIRTATPTWEVQTVLMSDAKGLTDAAVRATDELLDGFAVAYRSANAAGAEPAPPAK